MAESTDGAASTVTKAALAEAVADKFGLRREDLPEELQTEDYAQTACKYCGISFLVATEMREMQDRLVSAEATVEGWRDRIARTTRAESERDDAVRSCQELRAKVQAMAKQRRSIRQAGVAAVRTLRDARKSHSRLQTAVHEALGAPSDVENSKGSGSKWLEGFCAEWMDRSRGFAEMARAQQLEASISTSRKHSQAVAEARAASEEAVEAANEEIEVLRSKLGRMVSRAETAEAKATAAEESEAATKQRLAEAQRDAEAVESERVSKLEAMLIQAQSATQTQTQELEACHQTYKEQLDAVKIQLDASRARAAEENMAVLSRERIASETALATLKDQLSSLQAETELQSNRAGRAEADVKKCREQLEHSLHQAADLVHREQAANQDAADAKERLLRIEIQSKKSIEELSAALVAAKQHAKTSSAEQAERLKADLTEKHASTMISLQAEHASLMKSLQAEHTARLKEQEIGYEARLAALVVKVGELKKRVAVAEATTRSTEAQNLEEHASIIKDLRQKLHSAESETADALARLKSSHEAKDELQVRLAEMEEVLTARTNSASTAEKAIARSVEEWHTALSAAGGLLVVLEASERQSAAAAVGMSVGSVAVNAALAKIGAKADSEGIALVTKRARKLTQDLREEVDSMRLTIEKECAERMFLMEELNGFREQSGMERLTMDQVRRGGATAHSGSARTGSARAGSRSGSGSGGRSDSARSIHGDGVASGGLRRHGSSSLASAGQMALGGGSGSGSAGGGSWTSARGRAGARRGHRR